MPALGVALRAQRPKKAILRGARARLGLKSPAASVEPPLREPELGTSASGALDHGQKRQNGVSRRAFDLRPTVGAID